MKNSLNEREKKSVASFEKSISSGVLSDFNSNSELRKNCIPNRRKLESKGCHHPQESVHFMDTVIDA